MTLTVRLKPELESALELHCAERGVTKSLMVQEVLAAMNERFAVTTENITTAVEEVVFKLPRSLTA